VFFLISIFIADLLYGYFDPRTRTSTNTWVDFVLKICLWPPLYPLNLFLSQTVYAHLFLLNLKPCETVDMSCFTICQGIPLQSRWFELSKVQDISISVKNCLDHWNNTWPQLSRSHMRYAKSSIILDLSPWER